MARKPSESTAVEASLPLTMGMVYLNYQSVLAQLLSQSGLERRCRELNAELVGIMTAGLSDAEAGQVVGLLGRVSRNLSQIIHLQTTTPS